MDIAEKLKLHIAQLEQNLTQHETVQLLREALGMIEGLRTDIAGVQGAWEGARLQRDELMLHITSGAPLPEWASKWIKSS